MANETNEPKTDWRSWAIHALCVAVDIIQNGKDLTDEEYEAMEKDGDTGFGLAYLEDAFQKEDVPQRIVDFIYSIADEGLEMSRQKNLAK